MAIRRATFHSLTLGGQEQYGIALELEGQPSGPGDCRNLVFVLDRSASLYGADWLDALIEAVRAVCPQVRPGRKFSIDLFAERWATLSEPTPLDSATLQAALWRIREPELGSGTSFEALANVLSMRANASSEPFEVVLVTDAQPSEAELSVPIYDLLCSRKVPVHVVALKPRELVRLKSLAERTGGGFARATQSKDIRKALESVLKHQLYRHDGETHIDIEWPDSFPVGGLMRVVPSPQLFLKEQVLQNASGSQIDCSSSDGRTRVRARLTGESGVMLLSMQRHPELHLGIGDIVVRDEEGQVIEVNRCVGAERARWSTWQRACVYLFASAAQSVSSPAAAASRGTVAAVPEDVATGGSTFVMRRGDLDALRSIVAQATPEAPRAEEPEQGEPILRVEPSGKMLPEGTSIGTEFRFNSERLVIGRYDFFLGNFPDVDLTLFDPDRTVSREHAVIERTPEGYFLTDLGATNGVRLGSDGQVLTPGERARVRPGDSFLCGSVRLHLHLVEVTAAVP